MIEIWKDIDGFVGLYRISNLGRVWSTRSNIIRKQHTARNGYKHVSLSVGGKCTTPRVHRLVAIAFLDNPNNLPMVCHKDDNPGNNVVTNLFWGSQLDNMRDMIRKGRDVSRATPIICINTGVEYPSQLEAARALGLGHSSINAILVGRRESVFGYKFKYKELK